ncbi:GNAT family N-acetyltransferase [Pseudoroseomonas rhizosphaerae]|uniref:GNAT family N-acetyltransferase n=1 Tax=Teichococcus rhizosphaerae TaxID=1335062 RepID=A0A2C6XZW3_9PROT|nr:GNAT family N-acetyltransferase [Pseudoroseomonas rhizosphaerae]PHK94072.1 GNAT family N-acetyltransferase [Pseudoroseomonas rhizosphaerae]
MPDANEAAPAKQPAAVTIRPATAADMDAVAAIYRHHVLHGTATFETEAPTAEDMRQRRITLIERGLPYLVAEDTDGRVLGYAYAGAYRPRPAYRNTLENSVYISEEARGRGIGRRLLEALIQECAALGYRQMVAVIGDSANEASIRLHRALGFEPIGTLRSVGRKHGRWLDTVLMQLALGDGDRTDPAVE